MTEALGRPVPFAAEPIGCSDRDKRTGLPNAETLTEPVVESGAGVAQQVERTAVRMGEAAGSSPASGPGYSTSRGATGSVSVVTLVFLDEDGRNVGCQAGGNEREPRVRSDTGPLTYQVSVGGGRLHAAQDLPGVSRLVMHTPPAGNTYGDAA